MVVRRYYSKTYVEVRLLQLTRTTHVLVQHHAIRLIGGGESKIVGEIKPKPDTANTIDIFWRCYTDDGNPL